MKDLLNKKKMKKLLKLPIKLLLLKSSKVLKQLLKIKTLLSQKKLHLRRNQKMQKKKEVVVADDKETVSEDVKREREEEAEVAKLRKTDPEAADALETKQAKDEKDKQKNKLTTAVKPINKKLWDNRENTDKYRVLATSTVIK